MSEACTHYGVWEAGKACRKCFDEAQAEVERLRGMIEQADIEGWTVKGLKGATAALHGEGEKP